MTRDEARAKLVELTGIVPHSLSLAARIEAAIDAFEAAVLRVVPPEGGPRPDALEALRGYLGHKAGCVHDDNSTTPRCPCGLLQAIGELLRLEPNNDTANLRSEPNGMPSEPSEEALEAALKQYHKTTAYWAPELMGSEAHIEKLVGDIIAAAYAAERGVSAVPPTEEPNE